MDALAFLDKAAKAKRQPVYALIGDEAFLKRHCREAIVTATVGEDELAVSQFPGDKLDFSTVRNELFTRPFLSDTRLVLVDNADPFVSAHREALEKYLPSPSPVGILVLDVTTFPDTTRLAKAMPDAAKIQCKSIPPYKLPEWCVGWAKTRYGKSFSTDAANYLVELVGPVMGMLAQELEKLSTAVGSANKITTEDVDRLVGKASSGNVFRILDAVGEGKPAEALTILAERFDAGDDALAILGPLSHQLRKLAAVAREVAVGSSLGVAMDTVGVPKWPQARQSFERQLKHLGRRRLDRLTEWLVEINLGLKGGNPLPARLQVERLVVKLARPRD
jgi:DNA polymerase III subunit delta